MIVLAHDNPTPNPANNTLFPFTIKPSSKAHVNAMGMVAETVFPVDSRLM